MQPDERPPLREAVMDLFGDIDARATQIMGCPMHADGRPFTDEEELLYRSATPWELDAWRAQIVSRLEHQEHLVADQERLHQIAQDAPDHSREKFIDGLAKRGAVPGWLPEYGEVPTGDLERRIAVHIGSLVHVFRATILPDIGGPLRAEALEILERLAPYEHLVAGDEGTAEPT